MARKTDNQIEDQLDKARQWDMNSQTDVPGMSYEQGVIAAFEWILGETESLPIENDYKKDED